jgi:hypothetical protein
MLAAIGFSATLRLEKIGFRSRRPVTLTDTASSVGLAARWVRRSGPGGCQVVKIGDLEQVVGEVQVAPNDLTAAARLSVPSFSVIS